jgi:transketolase N-terminal domain/subunit
MIADEGDFTGGVTQTKLRLLQMHFESDVGHLGGNLSALDLLVCLYHRILQPDDIFILSRGHAAGALYATLWSTGALSDADLRTFHKDGTRLSGHPPLRGIPEVLFATGRPRTWVRARRGCRTRQQTPAPSRTRVLSDFGWRMERGF